MLGKDFPKSQQGLLIGSLVREERVGVQGYQIDFGAQSMQKLDQLSGVFWGVIHVGDQGVLKGNAITDWHGAAGLKQRA